MQTNYYIDTRPGAPGLFAAPAQVEDYGAWLYQSYWAAKADDCGRTVYYGIAQKINEIALAVAKGAHVMVIGPHAEIAATVLRRLSNEAIMPEVLP